MRKYLQLVFLAVSVFCSEILLAESRDPVPDTGFENAQ